MAVNIAQRQSNPISSYPKSTRFVDAGPYGYIVVIPKDSLGGVEVFKSLNKGVAWSLLANYNVPLKTTHVDVDYYEDRLFIVLNRDNGGFGRAEIIEVDLQAGDTRVVHTFGGSSSTNVTIPTLVYSSVDNTLHCILHLINGPDTSDSRLYQLSYSLTTNTATVATYLVTIQYNVASDITISRKNGLPYTIHHSYSNWKTFMRYKDAPDGAFKQIELTLPNLTGLISTYPFQIRVMEDGAIYITYTIGTGGVLNTNLIISKDEGKTWGSPIPVSAGSGFYFMFTDKERLYLYQQASTFVQIRPFYNGAFEPIRTIAKTYNFLPSFLHDRNHAASFGETPAYVHYNSSTKRVEFDGEYITNKNPLLTLDSPNNQTLYENDIFRIEGQAQDADAGDIVNVRYQINAGTARAIATAISDGSTLIPFNRQLTFKGGILYDGQTAITSALAEGVAHTLKVWAEDDKGGKSTVEERTFYVVPNRPPVLSVDPFTSQSDLISNDKITIKGTSSDPDGNDVVVSYKLNSGLATQIHSGPTGSWTFDLQLKQLKDGENTIIIEVIDTYDFKTSKTIKLNKHMHLTPLSQSIQRYKIIPPAGSAQGVLLWIQRDSNQVVLAEISMTTGAEQEQFVPMTLTNTAPVSVDVVEDEFTFQSDSAKENIVLKITTSGDKPITLISGVLS